jgi:MFS family permease
VNTAWALGLIVGPALGGFLAQVPFQKKNEKDRRNIFSPLTPVSFLFHSLLKNILTYFPKIQFLPGKSSKHNYNPLLIARN